MRYQQIDQFAAELKADTRAAVYQSTKGTHEKRTRLLFDHNWGRGRQRGSTRCHGRRRA